MRLEDKQQENCRKAAGKLQESRGSLQGAALGAAGTAGSSADADGCFGPLSAVLGILLLHTQADCPPDGTAYSLRNI